VRILLLRHAETEGNRQRRYIGRSESGLTDDGIAFAQSCLYAPVEQVYASPLSRCQKTAELLFPGIARQLVEDLVEMDFGDFEGHSADELKDDAAYRAWVDAFCVPNCPNGESRSSFSERVLRAFDQVIADAEQRKLHHLAVVAHGGTCMAIMSQYAKDAGLPEYQWITSNCAGYSLELDANAWLNSSKAITSWQAIDGQDWRSNAYAFFQHRECEYFPCHDGADPEDFNCLFCYCPLYAYGQRCSGNFRISSSGVKDCQHCLIPHNRLNYALILKRLHACRLME
jgi:alpha-ribazole phosphatase